MNEINSRIKSIKPFKNKKVKNLAKIKSKKRLKLVG